MALGKLIAKGKESDVYEVLSTTSDLYALKLFRLGRTSFRDVNGTVSQQPGGAHLGVEQLQRREARVRRPHPAAQDHRGGPDGD